MMKLSSCYVSTNSTYTKITACNIYVRKCFKSQLNGITRNGRNMLHQTGSQMCVSVP